MTCDHGDLRKAPFNSTRHIRNGGQHAKDTHTRDSSTFNSTRHIRNADIPLRALCKAQAFNSTRHIRNPRSVTKLSRVVSSFNSTRHIRNDPQPLQHRSSPQAFNSTRHIRNWRRLLHLLHTRFFRLSTPHGTLGTEFMFYLKNNKPVATFNSTRHIRNREFYGPNYQVFCTFNSTRHIRNKSSSGTSSPRSVLSTPHGTLGTGARSKVPMLVKRHFQLHTAH